MVKEGHVSELVMSTFPHGPGVTGPYSEKLGLPIRKIEIGGTNYGFYGSMLIFLMLD